MKINSYYQRFKSSFERFSESYIIDDKTSCWIWTSYRLRNSKTKKYDRAAFTEKGKKIAASRWSYSYFKEKIPKKMFVCHSCDNPLCVNPDHLFIGSHIDNMRDLYNKNLQKRGASHGMSKLSEEKVLLIFNSKLCNKDCGTFYNVPTSTVFNIRNGYTWSHITGVSRKYWKPLKIKD